MYINERDVRTNELRIIYNGTKVTIKGTQIIVNDDAESQLLHTVNDLVIRQATSFIISVQGIL